eukprot:gene57636-biopygen6007
MRPSAAAIDFPTEVFVKERDKLATAMAAFYNRLLDNGGAEGMLDAEILLLPKTDDEFDPVKRRPIVIGQVIARCLTKILDDRLRDALTSIREQGGFKKDVSAEDIAATFQIFAEHAGRMGIDSNIFITDWERMYDSIPTWLPVAILQKQGAPVKIWSARHAM